MAYLTSLRDGGFWTGRLWPEAQVQLARLQQALGDTTAASRYVTAALSIWRRADADFEPAIQARRLLDPSSRNRTLDGLVLVQ